MWYCDACHRWHTRAVEVITADGRHICQRRWQQECPHEHTILATSDGHHFSAGDIWDDIREMVYCRICGKRLPLRFSLRKPSPPEDTHLEAAYEDRFEIPF